MAENEVVEVGQDLFATNQEAGEHICKRCGFDQHEEFIQVNQADLETYFKAALAQTPFSYTYSLYGGLLQVTFEEATGKLLRLQEKAIMDMTKKGPSVSDAADYSMLASLVEVRQVPENGPSRVLYAADQSRREDLLSNGTIPEELLNMPMIQLQALRSTYTVFTKHCVALMYAAQDENFWKGVGRS